MKVYSYRFDRLGFRSEWTVDVRSIRNWRPPPNGLLCLFFLHRLTLDDIDLFWRQSQAHTDSGQLAVLVLGHQTLKRPEVVTSQNWYFMSRAVDPLDAGQFGRLIQEVRTRESWPPEHRMYSEI